MQVIILQTETIFFLFRLRPAASPSIFVTHYLFPSLKNPEKELRKICAVETAKENKQTKKPQWEISPHFIPSRNKVLLIG